MFLVLYFKISAARVFKKGAQETRPGLTLPDPSQWKAEEFRQCFSNLEIA